MLPSSLLTGQAVLASCPICKKLTVLQGDGLDRKPLLRLGFTIISVSDRFAPFSAAQVSFRRAQEATSLVAGGVRAESVYKMNSGQSARAASWRELR